MSASAVMPNLLLAGSLSGNPSGLNDPGQLELAYQNLLSGATDIISAAGIKTLVLSAGAITTAASLEIGVNETASEVANNLAVLREIAAFCQTNGISIMVEANLTDSPTWSSGVGAGHNELVDQWAQVAASVGLPITMVEDVQEIATISSPSNFTNYASIEANAVKTLIADYSSSTYHLTAANLSVGDMEGGPPSTTYFSQWWDAYKAAAAALGVPGFSFATADTGWFGPWIGPLSRPSWQTYLETLSTIATQEHLSLNVLVQGTLTDTSADQFVAQAEQNAADLARLQALGLVNVNNILMESWDVLPVGVGMLSSPGSTANEGVQIKATYPLYLSGLINAQGPCSFSRPGQVVLTTGVNTSIVPLTIQWALADSTAGNRLAVVIVDQTGTLQAVQYGSGVVCNPTSNVLVLNGNSVDLAAELSSVSILETQSGADTIDIETYGEAGRLFDAQISVLSGGAGQSVSNIVGTSGAQGWISASAILNHGTVLAAGSVLTQETLYWSTTGGSAFVNTVSIHEPLAEYGVEDASGLLLGTASDAVVDIFDPNADRGSFPANGYANNRSVNNVSFAPLPDWLPNAFDPAAELTPLIVASTVNTFNPTSGLLEMSVANLAPDPLTVVDQSGTHANLYATAFNNGGTQVTEFNTGSNVGWQVGWGSQFASATLTYDDTGRLVELFLQGGSGNPLFTIDDVFDPNTGHLWEEFQSTNPPPEAPNSSSYTQTGTPYQAGYATGPLYVTEFNTGDNPNWDYVDWGSSIASDTEVWTDHFIMENFAGFVENYPAQYAGGLNAYPYEFVNGSTLDLMYLPGTIRVDLNSLGTITLASQAISSGLGGLTAIDAAGATGNVTITGLAAGGSTLIGGDVSSSIFGSGHDTITAGAGVTTIHTGSGGSIIQVSSATGSTTVVGDSNVVQAVADSTVYITGSSEIVNGSEMSIYAGTDTSVTVNGVGDTIYLGGPNITIQAAGSDVVVISGTDGMTATIAFAGPVVVSYSSQPATGQTTVSPFAGLMIKSTNIGQTVMSTATVKLSNAATSELTNFGDGSFNSTTGIYTVVGSVAAVSKALGGLVLNLDSLFNTSYYLDQNPDVAASGVDPLTHYETYGWKEGRDPSADFSTDGYLRANPDVAAAGLDPLLHYLDYGVSEGRMTFIAQPHGVGEQNPLVDNSYYFAQNADVRALGINPFTHYDTYGWQEGRNPDALFNTTYYLQQNPDVAAAHIDPLLHYEQYGWREGRNPSADFSTTAYLNANPDVKAAGLDPLVHYEQFGMQEGRAIFHV